MSRELKRFVDERPKSKALSERARKSLLAGVPMNWMMKWAGAFPPFVREAQGAVHAFVCDESGNPFDAFSQYGADVAADGKGGCRSAQ